MRKENKPAGSAMEMAASMGIELPLRDSTANCSTLASSNSKTSSWVARPRDVRSLGGALFCDRRYGKVFVYHNGAQSYYAARGFRGSLRCERAWGVVHRRREHTPAKVVAPNLAFERTGRCEVFSFPSGASVASGSSNFRRHKQHS